MAIYKSRTLDTQSCQKPKAEISDVQVCVPQWIKNSQQYITKIAWIITTDVNISIELLKQARLSQLTTMIELKKQIIEARMTIAFPLLFDQRWYGGTVSSHIDQSQATQLSGTRPNTVEMYILVSLSVPKYHSRNPIS